MRSVERLRLLASAIAGQAVDVAAAGRGESAWTDGSIVFVDDTTSSRDQIRMLGVQASLVAAGSLDPAVLGQLIRRPVLTQRYLALEGHRALLHNEEALPPAVRSLIDRDVASSSASPAESLEMARRRSGTATAPPAFGTLYPRRVLASAERSARSEFRFGEDTRGRGREQMVEVDADQLDDDEPTLGHLLSSPVGGGGPIGRLLQRMLRPARRRGGGGPPGADAPTWLTRRHPGDGSRVTLSTSRATASESATPPDSRGLTYPEWDVNGRRYRIDWCTVLESEPPGDGGSTMAMPDAAALLRALARLGMGLTRCRRQPQGDDIDVDAAVEAQVDTAAGSPHGDDYYVASLRQRRDLAVLVLLDISGSAAEPGTAGRPVHEHQRFAAAALTLALYELGDRVALYTFNSRGRKAVQLYRVKPFDAVPDGRLARRLAGLAPAGYTRLGAAIRHGTAVLADRGGTPRRLLVVLSDGFAYDHGYEGRYGEADARRALVEARRRGIGCLCLSVGAATTPEALQRVFGTAAHATVPRPEQLPAVLGPLFRAALQSAEAQHRTHQRKERTKERLEVERRTHGSSGPAVLRAGR